MISRVCSNVSDFRKKSSRLYSVATNYLKSLLYTYIDIQLWFGSLVVPYKNVNQTGKDIFMFTDMKLHVTEPEN